MSVPRAKKKKRPAEQYDEKFRRAKVAEAIKLCLAEAIWLGYTYYGYREKRLMRIVSTYISEMDVVNEMGLTARDMASRANRYVDTDVLKECEKIKHPYRRDCYYLCIGVMVHTLKKLKFKKSLLYQYVKSVVYGVNNLDIYGYIKDVADITGFNVHTKVHW